MSATRTEVEQATTMRAAVRERYGPEEVIEVRDVPKPAPEDDCVLVRVRATSVNKADWYILRGQPYVGRVPLGLRAPKSPLLGADFAGIAEAVGKDVTDIKPGDEVFGARGGAFAQYVSVRNGIALKPAHLSFEEAAAVPVAATTALQGVRDKGKVQAGEKVLINGASGGVGTFAVQIAKAFGADVTAVCSPQNVELARLLGADRVIDYTRDDFTRTGERYDVLFDNAGSKTWSKCRRVMKPHARVVLVGGQTRSRLLGPLTHTAAMLLGAARSSQKAAFFVAKITRPDMNVLRELLETRKVSPVIDRRYDFDQLADALRYLGEGHAKGKIVVSL